jgi:hypothetical protein
MHKVLFTFLLVFISFNGFSQDLNCNVSVISSSIQRTDKRVFTILENSISEFMNQKWTNDAFLPNERIDCTIIINLTEYDGVNQYQGSIQVQSTRPVFNTSYNTSLLVINDRDFTFTYNESEPLYFQEIGNQSNLTSVLAYYAYLVIGMDYDTYSFEGGTPYYQKALAIVNNAQNFKESGWKAFEDTKNRYWIIENLLNNAYKPFRKALYEYHRFGLDVLQSDIVEGRKIILSCLDLLETVWRTKPGNLTLQTFFFAKKDEIGNLFQKAEPSEKTKVLDILSRIDPVNGTIYQKLIIN